MVKFVEIEGFDWNWPTFVFLAIIGFIMAQMHALIKQNKKIVKMKSGKAISFIFFAFLGFSSLGANIYGLYNHSLALTLNILQGIICLIVAGNILKFEKINRPEKLLGFALALIVPAMIVLNNKDFLFLLLGLVLVFTLFLQLLKLWRSDNAGAYDISQVLVGIPSSSFWLTYAFIAHIWPLQIINAASVTIWLSILVVYIKKTKLSTVTQN